MKKLVVGLLVVSALIGSAGCHKKPKGDGGEIGVAECDEYITKYTACIAKMPAQQKTIAEQGFKAQVDAWKAAASTPEGKKALKSGCTMTLASVASNPLCK